jgi:hypothetical protein
LLHSSYKCYAKIWQQHVSERYLTSHTSATTGQYATVLLRTQTPAPDKLIRTLFITVEISTEMCQASTRSWYKRASSMSSIRSWYRYSILVRHVTPRARELSPSSICTLKKNPNLNFPLIIIPPRNNLLNIRPQQNRMLILRRITALNIHQRRVILHNPGLDQIIQPQQILIMPQTVQIPATERQRAEILLNSAQQSLSALDSESHFGRVVDFRVVRALHVLVLLWRI